MTNKEAKEKFFLKLGREVMEEFLNASVKDLIDFADKLKEWAVQTPLTKSGVEQTNERESFYTSKL